MPDKLLSQIQRLEEIAAWSKLRRFLNKPLKYFFAMFWRHLVYPGTGSEFITETKLFFGRKIKIALPASMDIYLTGGKSHPSEVRLARFLILNLKAGDQFLDVGAHFGYFSLLAAEIVGPAGKIRSYEPAGRSYNLLLANTAALNNISTFQMAVSNSDEDLVFYEFSTLYSEYNSTDVSQFENEAWYRAAAPQKLRVKASSIDRITEDKLFMPRMIKIDVEGGEFNVIEGGAGYFKSHSPKIVMEYLAPGRNNSAHKKALELLKSWGYRVHVIAEDGSLKTTNDLDDYLLGQKLESDNVVFIKVV